MNKKYFAGLSASTFLLAFGSFFADVSSEMLYPILPIFLTEELGASTADVGFIEGVAQGVQYLAQGVSGWYSDRLARKKGIALVGYTLAALSKASIGFASSWGGVLAGRGLDRLGAGTRSAPRDALVAASVAESDRGKAFGVEGFGDNLGAFVGPLVAVLLMSVLHVSMRSMFFLALIPGVLATLTVLFVREARVTHVAHVEKSAASTRLPREYWKVIAVTAIFGIGNSSNSFLILRTKDLGASLPVTIFVYAAFNLVAALASYPAGHLSDRFGRRNVLLLSFVVFLVVYLGFAMTSEVAIIALLFPLYGVYQGAFRSVGKALATDFAPASRRATGVGWYTATIGVTGFIASTVGGELWTRVGPPATFFFGAASALAGSIALVALVPERTA